MINDGINAYVYDAEGRLCAAENILAGSATQYVYDAAGTRVAKGTISTWPTLGSTCAAPTTANGFTLTNEYLLDQAGEQVTEINSTNTGTWGWAHSNVWAGAQLDATYDMDASLIPAAPALHFHLADPLGTRRVQLAANGAIEETCQSLPFGDGLNCPLGNPITGVVPPTADDATENHFTGKERDSESGNDYFGARYYASTMGRFLSPDPKQISRKRMMDPQSWNMYAYTRNNPLVLIDPDGAEWEWAGARSDANAGALLTAFAIAYQTSGRFQNNFDAVANSTTTMVRISDAAVPNAGSNVVTMGVTGPLKSAVTFGPDGNPVSVASPTPAVEKLDVTKIAAYNGASDLPDEVKHETQHAEQLNQDPLGYVKYATNPTSSSLENAAIAASNDNSPGISMTFGQALSHVMDAIYHPPPIQTETPVLNEQIKEQ